MKFYLDHNSGTPVDERVLERFLEVERACPGNPGSAHAAGRRARAALEQARHDIAAALGVGDDAVTFVSGGTEANNTAVLGLGDPSLPVLLGPIEHPSVLRAAEDRGAVWWEVDAGGRVRVAAPRAPIGLVCLTHGQNEVGALQPIAEAAAVAAACRVPLHVDVSQTLGRLPMDPVVAVADSLTVSPHKLGGPRGLGVLIARDPGAVRPLIRGGSQEQGRRAGTPSPALAAAAALAIELGIREQAERARAMRAAREAFENAVQQVPHRRLTSEPSIPNTLMLSFEGLDGRILLPALDLAGVEASQGAACSTGAPTPSRALLAMGLTESEARCSVRFSFGWRAEIEHAARAGAIVVQVVRDLIGAARVRAP